MKLLDENEYEKTLKELMKTPFGEYQQKPTLIQSKTQSKVIYEQPIEILTMPVSAMPQP